MEYFRVMPAGEDVSLELFYGSHKLMDQSWRSDRQDRMAHNVAGDRG